MLPDFILILSKNHALKHISFPHSGAGFILHNMTPKTFFEKYKRVVIPFQLRLDERAFGISNEESTGNTVITTATFILKKHTDREKIKALSTTFPGNDPNEVFQDLLRLQKLCEEKE
ncbi:MAG: hypothetical protein GX776_05455 [Oxalobacter sp.]|nr:hypothetical protein [Oxalobacter sp.]